MVMDIDDAQYFLEKEKLAENYAVPFVYGVNFSDCLRIHMIDTEIEVDGKKIQAARIYGLWDTYLIAIGEVTGQTVAAKTKSGKKKEKPVVKHPDKFTDLADYHMKKMLLWLTADYTELYKSFATEEEQTWLSTVIRFIVYRRITETKYHKWMTTGKGFADIEVARKIADVYRFKYEMPSIARLIHEKFESHKKDEPPPDEWRKQLAQEIITGVFDLLRADRLRLLPPVGPDDMPQIEGGEEAV